MQNTDPKKISFWRISIPLLLQTVIILAVPAQAMLTYFTGRTVILQTAPVDPYDLLRGYSQTLNYEISSVDTLKALPGWDTIPVDELNLPPYPPNGTPIYVILEAPEKSRDRATPLPWEPVRVSATKPQNLPENQSVVRGIVRSLWVDYGIERYYMPEDQRNQINQEIRDIQRQFGEEPPFVVEVKTRPNGNVVAVSLWLGDRHYRF